MALRRAGSRNSFDASLKWSAMRVPRASSSPSPMVKLPLPSELQRQASFAPALRETTSTRSATMKAE